MNSENLPLETSPLTEVPQESLSELFQRDPLKLTKTDLERICKELRAQRAQWQIEDAAKQAKPKKAKAAAKPLMDAELNSILDDLL